METLVRYFCRAVLKILYRFDIAGEEHVPSSGGALIICNHVSFIDGFLLSYACFDRPIHFMIWKPYYDHWLAGLLLRYLHLIPVATSGPRGIVESLKLGRKAVESGQIVAIFPEGSITRTGNILPFRRGMEKIVEGLNVPIIPVHLDGVWGSFFSFRGGKFFGNRIRLRMPIRVTFGKPLTPGISAFEARQKVIELSADAFSRRKTSRDTLGRRFLRMVRRNWGKMAFADSTGREVTYGRAATGALVLAGEISKRVAEPMVGVLLPSTVGGALANLGVTLAGKTAVNLNFTAGKDGMAHAIGQCGIRSVLTSKVFLAKAKLDAPEGAIYVEDLLKVFSGTAKLWALIKARVWPVNSLSPESNPDSLATVIFSSGSTGVPKGVMLSHFNIVSNIDSVLEIYQLTEADRIIGVLPMFHSFGYTVTLWLPPLAGCAAIYHPNPIEAKAIGDISEKYKGTFLLATPTFASTYTRKCGNTQFASLRYALVGAEKLRDIQRDEFQTAFGVELLEGYGMTEMAPVVAVNSPDVRDTGEHHVGTKHGTVGLPIPGVAARIVDPDTREPKPVGEPGMLLVRGPNQMLGYLNQPERTADSMHEGWYITGDIAVMDDEGFLRITDRLSRFSKIGGEMVPHVKIEDAVMELTGHPAAVTGVPDDRKGESLVVLFTGGTIAPDELWRKLSATELPNLWVPKREAMFPVESLPLLGTGKLDLRGVKQRALELSGKV